MTIGDKVRKQIARIDALRKDEDPGPAGDVVNSAVSIVEKIREFPAPVQVGVGTATGLLTGYIFTKGSKVAAGVVGISLVVYQNKSKLLFNMDTLRKNVCIAYKCLLLYISKILNFFIPGPHKLPKLSVRDRTVLITGGSSGLGRDLAKKFYEEGAKVIVTARRTDELKKVCEELKAMKHVDNNNDPAYRFLDMCNIMESDIEDLVSLSPNGRIDVLVNNAGLSSRGSCDDTPMEIHRQVMEVNYFGLIQLTIALLERIPNDGAIVVTNSLQGKIGVPYRSAYSASKHALTAFFDSLRCEKRPNLHILPVFATYMNTGFGSRALGTDGKPVNVPDADQAKGISAEDACNEIYEALVNREPELVLAPLKYRLAILGRWFWPSLFFYFLYRRSMHDPFSKKD